jgi:1-acyl-sn-glycerol-3-phosphate acyltransferase
MESSSPKEERFILPYWIAESGQRITMLITGSICRFFFRTRITGKENIKDIKPGVVFAMNHTSEWDAIILPNVFNVFSKMVPIYIISLESKFYREHHTFRSWFYGGNFFRFMGAFPVIVGIKDYEKSLAFQIQMLKKGKNVLIFPEGSRSKDGKLQPAKGGVVALAKIANVPIVPVGISGVLHVTAKEFFLRKRQAVLYFGKPISPEELFFGNEKRGYSGYSGIADKKIMATIKKMLQNHAGNHSDV